MTTDTPTTTRIYDAEHRLPPIRPYLQETLSHLRFAFEKARLDRRGAHKDSWFGRLWNVLNPMLLGFVYWLLVIVIFGRGGESGLAVLTQILGGLFLYQLPSGSLSLGARSIVGGGSFILNTRIPRMILPISAVISAFLNFVPSLAVYAIFHVISGYPIGVELLWTIPILVIVILLSLGLALVFATLNVYFRDVASFLPFLIRIWLYLSPVIYLYERIANSYNWALIANPLGGLFASWQQVLFEGTSPSSGYMAAGLGWAFITLIVGVFMFMRREREFAIRL
jgi:ABC-type polysaccharide/polyol phosphate export permease